MFANLFSGKKTEKIKIIDKYKIDFGHLGFSNDYVDILYLRIDRDVYFKDSNTPHVNHDVGFFVFDKYSFMLFFNVNEHGFVGNGFHKFSIPTLSVVYFKENNKEGVDFSIVDQRFWYRQIDQMIDVLVEVDKINPGEFYSI